MNSKQAKKLRQIHNRAQDKFWGKALKTKPKWVPWKLWFWGMSIFINIEY